jgi:hypothetical protein
MRFAATSLNRPMGVATAVGARNNSSCRMIEPLEPRRLLSQAAGATDDACDHFVSAAAAEFVAAPVAADLIHSTAVLSLPRDGLAAITVGDKAFFAGGYTDLVKSDTVDIYDSVTGQWSTATLSQGRSYLAATSVGGKALFAGGLGSNVVDIYDIATGQWSTARLSQARGYLAATSVGTTAIFAGGFADGSRSNVVDIYDSATGRWSTAWLSQARDELAATTVSTKAFFAGGWIGSVPSDVVDIYDSATGRWSTARLSEPREAPAATTVGSKALFAGGFAISGSRSNIVDMYDSATGQWSTARLSEARSHLAATTVGTRALFAGGFGNVYPSNAVDIYDSATGRWSTARLSQARARPAATSVGTQALFAGGFVELSSDFWWQTSIVDIWHEPIDVIARSLIATPTAVAAGGVVKADRGYEIASFPADNFYIQYRLSSDRLWGNADDIAITQKDVLTRDGDKSVGTHRGTISLSIPPTIKAGSYYLLAKADSTGLVQEAKENNNAVVGSVITILPPANDAFAARSTIVGVARSFFGNNANATREPVEPQHAGSAGGHSVWWTWIAPYTGRVQIDTLGSGFNTLLGIYSGTSLENLSLVAGNDDISATSKASSVAFSAVRGQSYQIAVDGYGGSVGNIRLNVELTAGVLDDQQATLSNSKLWKQINGSYQGEQLYSAAGNGTNIATWTFSNLLAGTYRISATWLALPSAASNSPAGIYHGDTLLKSVAVNQRVNPKGSSLDGAIWQTLGAFKITAGSLGIKLTNNANGYVLADGIRIEKIA